MEENAIIAFRMMKSIDTKVINGVSVIKICDIKRTNETNNKNRRGNRNAVFKTTGCVR